MEPHKPSKLQSGRQRLIFVMALEDQMVDRCLFYTFLREQSKVQSIASKVGWSPLPTGYREFQKIFEKGALVTDCSAFDWTLPGHVAIAVQYMKLSQVRNIGLHPLWFNAIMNRMTEVVGPECLLQLPDGSCYRQREYGLMKSGWLKTISDNGAHISWMVSGAAAAMGIPVPVHWAMGDDLSSQLPATEDLATFVGWFEFHGVIVKQWAKAAEFSGFDFSKECEPLYPQKHRFILQFCPEQQVSQLADAYGLLYSLSDDEEMWEWIECHATYPRVAFSDWARGFGPGIVVTAEFLNSLVMW